MLRTSVWTALAFVAFAAGSGSPTVALDRACLTAAETREFMVGHKLTAVTAAQRTAALHVRAEPLRSRLCRWNDEYLYEVTLLRRDGKVVRVFVRGTDGLVVANPQEQLKP